MKQSRMSPRILALSCAVALASTGLAYAQAPATPAPATPAPGAPAATTAPAATDVLARVNGQPITRKDLEVAAGDLGERLPAMSEAQKQDYLLTFVIDLKIGAQAAEAAKIAESEDFARRVAYFRDKVLLDEFLSREMKKAVTPEAAQKLYDETVKGLTPEQEVRARHILVEGEEDAKKVAARVKGGEDFAKVAQEVSKDPGSGKEGGDLGYFSADRMVKEFADVAFALDVGKISDPVKSQFGWHVIKVEDKRNKPLPAFDEVKPQIDQYLERKAQQDMILALREKATIERLDQPAAPAAAPAAPKP